MENNPMSHQTEALSWLRANRRETAFAGNRFETTKEAIEAVKQLYDAGATRVDVSVSKNEPSNVQRYGGEYADRLIVYGTAESRDRLVEVIKALDPEGLGTEYTLDDWDGQRSLVLWWD